MSKMQLKICAKRSNKSCNYSIHFQTRFCDTRYITVKVIFFWYKHVFFGPRYFYKYTYTFFLRLEKTRASSLKYFFKPKSLSWIPVCWLQSHTYTGSRTVEKVTVAYFYLKERAKMYVCIVKALLAHTTMDK